MRAVSVAGASMRSIRHGRGWGAGTGAVVCLGILVACGGGNGGGDLSDVAADPGETDHSTYIPPPIDVQFADGTAGEGVVGDAGAQDPGPGDPGTAGDPGGGVPDEGGFVYACTPLAVESCVTACGSAGRRKCLKDWGPCFPPEEFCGNCVDDNCDGLINEGCAPNPACQPVTVECPVALIDVQEGTSAWTKDTLHLSGAGSYGKGTAKVQKWSWSVQPPAGATGTFQPSSDAAAPTFAVDAAGQYLFQLDVWDDAGTKSCVPAVAAVTVQTYPPLEPAVGCADGTREGFLDIQAYGQIAGCAGAWDHPGISPDTVVPTCDRKGGNSGSAIASGAGCSAPDLCAAGWHVCNGGQEVAQKSPTGCAGATPPDAKSKSLFFAIRQPSKNSSICGKVGDGFNDVFGCGNLGAGLGPDKGCGPLDRVLASTKPDSCGFNEAEPPLGPWECKGGAGSDLLEGSTVTKKACQGGSCSYDGYPVGAADKGGVLCCRD